MKPTHLITALLFVVPISLVHAAETSVLLKDLIRKSASEVVATSAVIKDASGQTTVTADEIRFDREQNSLVCVGNSSVSSGGQVIKGRDVSVEFGKSQVRVLVLRTDGTLSDGPGYWSFSKGAPVAPSFEHRLPNTDLDLPGRTRR